MSFVIDATVFGAWVFSDERNAYSEAALNALLTQKVVVPSFGGMKRAIFDRQ